VDVSLGLERVMMVDESYDFFGYVLMVLFREFGLW
jgi:hypothetical protein